MDAGRLLVAYMQKTNFEEPHCQVMDRFFDNLAALHANYRENATEALTLYQDYVRREWFSALTSQSDQLFNLSIINNTLLEAQFEKVRNRKGNEILVSTTESQMPRKLTTKSFSPPHSTKPTKMR